MAKARITRFGTNPLVNEGKRCKDCTFYEQGKRPGVGECKLFKPLVKKGVRHVSVVYGETGFCDQLKLVGS